MQTTKPLRVVSISDPALDVEAMGVEAYDSADKLGPALTRYMQTRDPALVKEAPGRSLTWFTVRRLDADAMDLIMSQSSEYRRNREAFRYAVTSIENLEAEDGQTYARLDADEERRLGPLTVKHLSDEQMALIATMYIEEIGGVAYAHSFLPRKNVVSYPQLRSWELVLKSKILQVVGDRVARLKEQTSAQPPEATEETASSGDGATDAPATAEATDD